MKVIKGDLLALADQGKFDVIIHGCNCFNTMGRGIALQIKQKYPAAWLIDQHTVRGDYSKLGTFTMATVNDKLKVVNAYTQYGMNSGAKAHDIFYYTALIDILQDLATKYPSSKFGLPKIGCGLAGGDEDLVMEIIQSFDDLISKSGGEVTVVEYQKN